MRIAVLSPVSHGSGASVISLLLALRLAQGTDKVCLTHVQPADTALRDISGVGNTVDKTTTPSMIIRTFQSAVTMSEEEYSQYCAAVTREVDLFTVTRAGDAVCSSDESRYLARYIAEKFPHKHVVVDVDDHSDEVVREVVGYSDTIVLVARTSRNEIRSLSEKLKEYGRDGVLSGKRIVVVCNRYNDAVVKQKELAALLGVKPAFVYVIAYNSYVAWAEFNNKFVDFWQFIKKGDSRVADVRLDLDKLAQGLRQKGSTGAKPIAQKLIGVKYVEASEDSSRQAVVTSPVSTISTPATGFGMATGFAAGFGETPGGQALSDAPRKVARVVRRVDSKAGEF
ncbi:hypothetical protein FACS1894208_01040 [Clostridia bacterium]|nr:hypothetical protein FACS1894208_01040 [Clostridia bacterium]